MILAENSSSMSLEKKKKSRCLLLLTPIQAGGTFVMLNYILSILWVISH